MFKNFLKTILGWTRSKGITWVLTAILGIFLIVFGYKVLGGIMWGIFLARNWDILMDFLIAEDTTY